MRFNEHKALWMDCEACPLCEKRRRVVLLRGKVPCDILFIGEAPGQSEDMLGKPFIGPAGKLLDQMIDAVFKPTVRWAMTNLVACIPLGEDGQKTEEPPKASIMACSERLKQVVMFCKPKLIVCVGKLAAKHWTSKEIPVITITHPAAVLRMDVTQRGLAYQGCLVALRDGAEEHLE